MSNNAPEHIDALIKRLTRINAWRRGAEIEQPSPTDIGMAIDDAITELRRMNGEIKRLCALLGVRCGK